MRLGSHSASPQGEPDIGIYFKEFSANAVHAIIECKRLDPQQRPSQLRRQYVVSGMDRFIKRPYGADHDLDFMVAYILSGNPASAMTDVNGYLKKQRRASDLLGSCSRFNSFGYVACSGHFRGNGIAPIHLLHSFLTFPAAAGKTAETKRAPGLPESIS